jgi:citronellyl-CoA dehydrogenase
MLTTFFRDEHALFRKSFREFVERELAPHADDWEAAQEFPREVFTRMGQLGFLGVSYPEEIGGGGGDYWMTVVWAEELARSCCAGLNMALMVQTDMATPIIRILGTPEQQAEFLTPAIRGQKIAALAVSEPGAGSDVAHIQTRARRVGGEYVIDGAKTFITNGTRADFLTLAVRTGEAGHHGLSLLLFPTDVKGFRVARKLRKLGNHASDTAELALEECRVPARYLLGEENRGFRYIMENFQGERLIAAVSSVASSELALQDAARYGSERTAFGHAILQFQVWRHQLADLATQVEAARWLTYRACDLYNQKLDATTEITMAKLFAGELWCRVTDRCLQLHGGYGYMDEFPISRQWRDARLITIGGGTSEIMREILAKRLGFG